jgi:hypothetical protein
MLRRYLIRGLTSIVLISVVTAVASAEDRSYDSVVKHIKSSYRAKRQGSFGLITFARFAVKVIRPAGFKTFKITMLRDLDYSASERPDSSEFHAVIRSKIDPSWAPLIQYSAPREQQWNYVYIAREKNDVKILVLVLQQQNAFVIQTKFDPDKLMAFIDDPKIMGISLRGDERKQDQPPQKTPAEQAPTETENKPAEKPPAQPSPIPLSISMNRGSDRTLSNIGSTFTYTSIP